MKLDHLSPRAMRFLLSLLTRIPFLDGVTLLLLLSERAHRESNPPFPPPLIYLQVGLFVLVGSAMAANLRRQQCALLYTGQIFLYAALLLTSSTLHYPDWLLARILTRIAGTAGIFLYLAFLCEPPESGNMRAAGRLLLGCSGLARAYSLLLGKEEAVVIAASVGGLAVPWLPWLQACLLAVAGVSLTGRGVGLGEGRALWLLATGVLLGWGGCEWNVGFWRRELGVDLWIQMRLLADDFTTLLGVVVVNNRCSFRI